MKLEKFIQTWPLAVAMQAGQLPAAVNLKQTGEATDLHAEASQPTNATATDDDVVLNPPTMELREETMELSFPAFGQSWEDDYEDEYERLVEKEALGTINRVELEELNRLQKIRRRFVSPPSGKEVLARHRREKLDRELLKVLRRYVRLQPITKNKA